MRANSFVASSIVDLIGNTPMLELTRLRRRFGLEGRLLAKLEYLNPGGSKKDRVALTMIRSARASGKLKEGQPVVEVTSGNTGTGLALVCRALGHPFHAVMSRGNSPERAQMMRAFGAEVCLIDQAAGGMPGQVSGADMQLVKNRAAVLVAELGAFCRRVVGAMWRRT
ncbi:MAG: pyridoxal-phosphate dependent enzyme [Tepidisphaeraceae bacterium]